MTRLLIIQPDASDPLGPLGDWLTDAGAELDLRQPAGDDLPADLDGYRGVVCLGGGMGAEDDAKHPWLADVRRLLSMAAAKGLPTLGICLGAQLLAIAPAAASRSAGLGPEVGPRLVSKKDAAWIDPLFADLPPAGRPRSSTADVDRGSRPRRAARSAPRYANQAFRLGRCVYGVQFHRDDARRRRELGRGQPPGGGVRSSGSLEHDALITVHADIEETWRPFAQRFVRLAAGELEPAVDRSNARCRSLNGKRRHRKRPVNCPVHPSGTLREESPQGVRRSGWNPRCWS